MSWKLKRVHVCVGFVTADVPVRARPYEGSPDFKQFAIRQIKKKLTDAKLAEWTDEEKLGEPPLACDPTTGHVSRQMLQNWIDLQLEPLGLVTDERTHDHCCVDETGQWWPCTVFRLKRGDDLWIADDATKDYEVEANTPLSENTRNDLSNTPYSIFVRWASERVNAGSAKQRKSGKATDTSGTTGA